MAIHVVLACRHLNCQLSTTVPTALYSSGFSIDSFCTAHQTISFELAAKVSSLHISPKHIKLLWSHLTTFCVIYYYAAFY